MNQSRSFLVSTYFILSLLVAAPAAAQSDANPAAEAVHEITLQVLVGSNDAGQKGNLPQNLANITRQLKGNFAFSDYRIANTFLGRLSNNGNLEYKSVSNAFGQESDGESQTFLEWSIGNLRNGPGGLQAQAFRFGARVPVKTSSVREEGGNAVTSVSYESIGLNIARVGIPADTPTLLGSLTLPKTNGTLFLVITVTDSAH